MTQLSLFSELPSNDIPLPIITSEKWGFPLQYHVVNGEYFYSIQDWIAGIVQSNPSSVKKTVNDMRRNFESSLSKMDYTATDGKIYKRDFAIDEILYSITQNMRSTKKRQAIDAIKAFLSKSGAKMDAIRIDRDKATVFADDVQRWHGIRENGKQKRNAFTEAAKDTHITHNPNYAALTNAEYHTLFKTQSEQSAKAEIVSVLGLDEKQAKVMRDHLNGLALTALAMAEEAIAAKMYSSGNRLRHDEQLDIVKFCAREVALTAHKLADYASIDLLTGKPLLNS